MDVRLTWTDCDEAGDYVVPNVLSSRGLVSRPDNMNETVLHTLGTFPLRQFIATCFHINVGVLFFTVSLLWLNRAYVSCYNIKAYSDCYIRSDLTSG